MRKKLRSTANYLIVFVLLILSIIGLVLPIIPGLVLFAIAIIILSFEVPYIERKIEKHVDPDTKFGVLFFKTKLKMERFFR